MAPRTCPWCRDDSLKVMTRTGLCERCNQVRLRADSAKRALGVDAAPDGADVLSAAVDHWVALEMPEVVKIEGDVFGNGEPDQYDLESLLNDIAAAAGHKELYSRRAPAIEALLDSAEGRKVFELLTPLGRAIRRKQRKGLALRTLDSRYQEAQRGARGGNRQ